MAAPCNASLQTAQSGMRHRQMMWFVWYLWQRMLDYIKTKLSFTEASDHLILSRDAGKMVKTPELPRSFLNWTWNASVLQFNLFSISFYKSSRIFVDPDVLKVWLQLRYFKDLCFF